jgi:predicted nucleic-acid-binding Zn-ribbon protein
MSHQCLKCKGELEEGFIPTAQGGGANGISVWWKGAPRKVNHSPSAVGDGVPKRRIKAYRCIECGFLELYATDIESSPLPNN